MVSLKNFLILQAFFVVLAAIYLLRKGPPKGVRLRLGRATKEKATPTEMNRPPEIWQGPTRRLEEDLGVGLGDSVSRSLNVHFNYNGHSWDAYEVLGLPAGSSFDKVSEAYSRSLAGSEPASREFYDHAFKAIEKQLKGS